MESAALHRISEMNQFKKLWLQIDNDEDPDIHFSLDADHVWREKSMLEEARNDPSGGLDFRRKCGNGLTNRHWAFGHIMTMK